MHVRCNTIFCMAFWLRTTWAQLGYAPEVLKVYLLAKYYVFGSITCHRFILINFSRNRSRFQRTKHFFMRLLNTVIACAACVLPMGSLFAQMTEDPTKWTFEAKKKSGNEYQLIYHLDLKQGWHIWSLKPGGDGFQIVPSFKLSANPKVKTKGAVTEKGKSTTTKMEGIDGKVTYLSGKIDYIQEATITGAGKITGKLTYQVCDDHMCLAPKDKDFVFDVK